MNKNGKVVDSTLVHVAEEIYQAEREIYLGKNIQENQAKIDKLMSDTPFDKLLDLAMLVETKTQHDPELKGFNFD